MTQSYEYDIVIIGGGTLAIQMGATAEDIAETIHAHPTLPEAIHYRKR